MGVTACTVNAIVLHYQRHGETRTHGTPLEGVQSRVGVTACTVNVIVLHYQIHGETRTHGTPLEGVPREWV